MNTIEVTKTVNNIPIVTYTKPLSKTCKKYLDLIKKRKFTKIEIQSFRKALNGSSTISLEEQSLLKQKFYDSKPINITKEQSDFGIAWLKNKAFKLNGQVRKSNPFGYKELEVIKNFKKFEFSSLYDINHYGNGHQYQPVYKVIAKNGDYFEYVAVAWGDIEIVG